MGCCASVCDENDTTNLKHVSFESVESQRLLFLAESCVVSKQESLLRLSSTTKRKRKTSPPLLECRGLHRVIAKWANVLNAIVQPSQQLFTATLFSVVRRKDLKDSATNAKWALLPIATTSECIKVENAALHNDWKPLAEVAHESQHDDVTPTPLQKLTAACATKFSVDELQQGAKNDEHQVQLETTKTKGSCFRVVRCARLNIINSDLKTSSPLDLHQHIDVAMAIGVNAHHKQRRMFRSGPAEDDLQSQQRQQVVVQSSTHHSQDYSSSATPQRGTMTIVGSPDHHHHVIGVLSPGDIVAFKDTPQQQPHPAEDGVKCLTPEPSSPSNRVILMHDDEPSELPTEKYHDHEGVEALKAARKAKREVRTTHSVDSTPVADRKRRAAQHQREDEENEEERRRRRNNNHSRGNSPTENFGGIGPATERPILSAGSPLRQNEEEFSPQHPTSSSRKSSIASSTTNMQKNGGKQTTTAFPEQSLLEVDTSVLVFTVEQSSRKPFDRHYLRQGLFHGLGDDPSLSAQLFYEAMISNK